MYVLSRVKSFFWVSVGTCLLLVLSFQVFSQGPQVFYKVWKAGDPATDQSTTKDPNNNNQPCHSGLWGWQGGGNNVRDDDFAAMVKPGVESGIYHFYSFSQCFGGGMFDELNALKGTHSGTSASLHNQLASYPLAKFDMVLQQLSYTGNGFDFTFAFERSMLLPGLASQKMATYAAANDPWGPNPNPFPERKGETQNSEQPVYFSSGAGATAVPLAPRRSNALAFLWSGEPNLIDQAQTAQMILYLRLLGYPISSIYVFYGLGMLPVANPVVTAFGPALNAAFYNDHIRQASSVILGVYFATKYALPAAQRPTYIVFFANDHGFNTCNNNGAAAPRQGGTGIPADTGASNGVGGGYSTSPPSE